MKRLLWKILILAFFLSSCAAGTLAHAELTQDQRKELSLHYYRGVVYYEAGRYEQSLGEFQLVVSLDPYFKDAKRYIDGCMRQLEQYRSDITGAKEDNIKDKKAVDLYFLGKAYYEKGDYTRALETFRAVLEKNPQDKFAQYYVKLCRDAVPPSVANQKKMSEAEEKAGRLQDLEKEVSYIKSDIAEQQDVEKFLRSKAERKSQRDELIRQKERQLKEQEELLEEERQDYSAQAKISKQADKIKKETEKWRNMKERLASDQPGVPAELTDYPITLDRAEKYYAEMKESLRTSRWNSAGLNAINASINYCDAILVYFYNVRSAEPRHENITRLLLSSVKRADTDANIYHMRSILNLKKLIENEDRPITRAEALFLSDHAEKLVEWCKSILP